MKKILGLAFALSLALPSGRAHAAMTAEQAGDKAIVLLEAMADIIDKDQDNCDKMAVDLNKYQDDNAALIKELGEAKAKRTPADKKAWQDKYKARLEAAQGKMMAGGQKCEKNEKVKAAFQRMR